MKNSICLICFKPNNTWFEFLSKFTLYDIYVVIDDNSKNYKEQYLNFNNVNIIQIADSECETNGFCETCTITIPKKVTGWSKALYYFSFVNTNYDKMWFFEDDVFFYNEQSLINIDLQYHDSDLLSNKYEENMYGNKNDWHWNKVNIKFSCPYYNAMICCVRLSSQLMSKIKNYANEHKTLFFSEALFPTMCKHYNLQYDTPYQLYKIVYRATYTDKDIDKNTIFHPIKDITKHIYYRDILNKNKT